MKFKTCIAALLLLCAYSRLQGQITKIQPLNINGRLPDITLQNIINYSKPMAKLSELQGNRTRLILFDFWLTSCIPCIHAFPKLDSLQHAFNGSLQVIMVTTEAPGTVQSFLKKWEERNKRKFSIPIVTADTVIQQYLRQASKPSYAWLAPDNILLAQTSASFISKDIITAYITSLMHDEVYSNYFKKDYKTQKPN
ncbi:TlpA family protein disulfide reductase [Parafilimonas sp.]|uniref:TlpA family protein disulfide reductase n=1 Tax=Parafilimonas sp. TaxID=1969739 RepID=UPI0039E29425